MAVLSLIFGGLEYRVDSWSFPSYVACRMPGAIPAKTRNFMRVPYVSATDLS